MALLILPGQGTASASGLVSPCNDANLTNALLGGGLITFDCGPNPLTITVSSQKVITQPTIVDGGSLGQVILSGGNITRVFSVESGGSLTLLNLVIRAGHDEPGDGGGAVYVNNSQIAITNTLWESNTSTCCGGALYVTNHATATIAGSTFAGNQALGGGDAGAIFNDATLFIAGSTLRDNKAGWAGAVENYGSLTVTHSSLSSNVGASNAGGLFTGGPAVLSHVAIFSNTVIGPDGWGGGLDDEYTGLVSLDNVQIYANRVLSGHSDYAGGGLSVFYGTLTMTNSSVFSNVVMSGPGGGIHVSYGATLTVVTSAIFGNQALAGPGGGIDARQSEGYGLTKVSLSNSTLSGNSATLGGGLSSGASTTPFISYVTFFNNSASAGQNISGTLAGANSIIAGGGSANCLGGVTSFGWNIEDGHSCALFAATDLTDTNPLLALLAFNGGPTPTNALLPGSPAIDRADPLTCPPADQRGALRPVDGDGVAGAVCDIGAFEYQLIIPRLYLPTLYR